MPDLGKNFVGCYDFPLGAHQLRAKGIRKDMTKKSCYACKRRQAKKNKRIMSQSKIAGRSVAW